MAVVVASGLKQHEDMSWSLSLSSAPAAGAQAYPRSQCEGILAPVEAVYPNEIKRVCIPYPMPVHENTLLLPPNKTVRLYTGPHLL